MASKNIDSIGPNRVRQFNVRRVISDDKRAAEVDRIFELREVQEVWFRLAAQAFVRMIVRATVHGSYRYPFLGKPLDNEIVDYLGFLGSYMTFGDPTLIRHDKQCKIAEAAQSRKGLRIKVNGSDIANETDVFDQCAVSVQENCWLFHDATPRDSQETANVNPDAERASAKIRIYFAAGISFTV
ncbi:MAG TPA: hypothetical protein VFE62_10995 [Gemmataceae bacterium]|nr:hypothetical protein [Gemmataceae bacterium]